MKLAQQKMVMKVHVNWRSNLLYLLSALFLSAVSTASPLLCQGLFSPTTFEQRKQEINEDLRARYWSEVWGKSLEEVQKMNSQTLAEIEKEIPAANEHRKQEMQIEQLNALLNRIFFHKVVSPFNAKYDQPGVSIGYCFGRATYTHLKLLGMGLQKESIQKIWAVGTMVTPDVTWDFHVATMAYTKDHGWIVMDTFLGQPVTVAEWMQQINSLSPDGMVRFYNTDASKFGLSLGKYDRMQMGLNSNPELDWYKGYFKDMMATLKEESSSMSYRDMKESTLGIMLLDFAETTQ